MTSSESERPERRARPRAGPLLRWYYGLKYRPFRRERVPHDGRRGLIVLQIDALAYADLRRALRRGDCPTIARLLDEEGYRLRRWFCGLPSATPYCQAGIFHGENGEIPAFRFYDKAARRVITCNAPHGVQYIRDRLRSPGALREGSSYVNLLDGDARTVAFTVATRERTSVYRRLGGTRMALLILLHPLRVLRMAGQAVLEWLLEEWERLRGEITGRVTHAEGIFPFIRILSNVVVRELQTLAIQLDVYLGVPVIYSTFMQYDELAHHFGPSSRMALTDLRRTDARIREIRRTMHALGGRGYDLVILSDHGMTPAVSYRVAFGESLGYTVQRILDGDPTTVDGRPLLALESAARESEYADMGAQVVEMLAQVSPSRTGRRRRMVRRVRDWVRRHYGIRDIVMPEKYRVGRGHDVVVTYSSCLALVYFADDTRRLELSDVLGDPHRAHLYRALLAHPGIGLVATLDRGVVHLASRAGRATLVNGRLQLLAGSNPLETYGTERWATRAVEELVRQPNTGDLVLFGAFDGFEIVSFDDQVGAHGSLGGDQTYPFLVTPPSLDLDGETLENARDIHRVIMARYARGAPDAANPPIDDAAARHAAAPPAPILPTRPA
ncbi:MAG TPA: alkaline phosphatase family protein [Gemmatimonadaceae bacterium]|nr:alkaline phosphatase family protein [Gemmatimonadaceae bacterium]